MDGFEWFCAVWVLSSVFRGPWVPQRGVFEGSRGSLLRVLKVVRVWRVLASFEGFWTVLDGFEGFFRYHGAP